MVLGIYLLTLLRLYFRFSNKKQKDVMDHLKCVQKLWLTWVYTNLNLNIDTITPEEYFKDSYVEELSG